MTHHLNPFASGVVRFNELLAGELGVPMRSLFDAETGLAGRPLFSFKVSELSTEERPRFESMLDARAEPYEVYLHDWGGSELELRLLRDAARVHCGNAEVHERVARVAPTATLLWTPGLLQDRRVFTPAEVQVFSFGMAHKIQTTLFRRLRRLLDETGRSYVVYVSTATHETKSIRDAQAVFEEMHEIFPERLFFMGNLSDVAVYNQLRVATFFAAFFPQGVRANNTSVAAALEFGSVILTNLDRHSPPELRHMDNVIDINRCESLPDDPLALRRISVRAMETARERGWEQLAARLRHDP
ncbi:hypothetical protein AYO39_03425 [Actinobacteria bacterium SCGC AG-212-D09]|nr:hypothetical protein AYO39_03425 [Actinobacteria bacterium SCGC AG-212-D09]